MIAVFYVVSQSRLLYLYQMKTFLKFNVLSAGDVSVLYKEILIYLVSMTRNYIKKISICQ